MIDHASNTDDPFPSTHWSEVARAADIDPQIKRQVLGRLLAAYMPALRAHLVAHKRINSDRADDLLQGFVCDQVVAEDLITRADRMRGRFRSFVLVALDRYVIRVRRHDNARVRCPQSPMFELNEDELPATEDLTADVFDLAWAREVVQRAIRKMRDKCVRDGREQVWQVFETCALGPLFDGTEPPPHRVTMQRLGFQSEQQVSNLLVTGKRMLARVLRSIVGEYAQDTDEIESELKDLWSILSRGGAAEAAPEDRLTQPEGSHE